ncbi:NfeD family protein [Rubripirellula reticaptiva]|nr:NfeD family protein [Rubripirellula reticaptiva]
MTEPRRARLQRGFAGWVVVLLLFGLSCAAAAQAQDVDPSTPQPETTVKTGVRIDMPVPMSSDAAESLVATLIRINASAPVGQRVTVVLRYPPDSVGGDETEFESALRLARAMSGNELRQVRMVSLVEGTVDGHSTLPILASDLLIVGPNAEIANAAQGEQGEVDTIPLIYQSIAKRRGLFPAAVVSALVDPELELALVSKVGGEQSFAAGATLDQLRADGGLLGEEVISASGVPLRLDAKQLRSTRIAAGLVESVDQAAELLDLAELKRENENAAIGEAKGVLLEITGSIASGRARRWQSNLDSTLSGSSDINTWMISIDSIGGNLDDSFTIAGWFASPQPPLQTVAGLVRGEARGDSAIIALACKPLLMKPDARLGGPGAQSIAPEDVVRYEELIDQIAKQTKRSSALIRGLLDTELAVYRYTHQKTGRIRYSTEEDLAGDVENPDAERAKWERGERIDLSEGLSASEAVLLGLADGESPSLEAASRQIGLPATPPVVADRGLVRLVERLGRNSTLSFLLLFIGFAAISAEANAPGLGVPAFLAIVSFSLFFWMKFLAGTAEWLELVALSVGLICIGIELFVVPGFGIFGVGGLMLTVLGVVLMSQTFVIPHNVYQLNLLSKGIWLALGGAAGMVGGFIAMRILLPHVPMFQGLIMEAPDAEAIDEAEKLGDFGHLMGQSGVATTPLRPSGKARFGNEILAVVSDGTSVSAGEPVRVILVQATKVVVEAIEN